MAILTGEGKPLADFSKLKPIALADKSHSIIGVFVSKTGKILHETRMEWLDGLSDGINDDDCPVNIGDWQGWCGESGAVAFPSHFRPLGK